jgi:hypothetical protein
VQEQPWRGPERRQKVSGEISSKVLPDEKLLVFNIHQALKFKALWISLVRTSKSASQAMNQSKRLFSLRFIALHKNCLRRNITRLQYFG